MKKKLLLLAFALTVLVSCGPHRMKCGPGKRCVDVSKKETDKRIRNT